MMRIFKWVISITNECHQPGADHHLKSEVVPWNCLVFLSVSLRILVSFLQTSPPPHQLTPERRAVFSPACLGVSMETERCWRLVLTGGLSGRTQKKPQNSSWSNAAGKSRKNSETEEKGCSVAAKDLLPFKVFLQLQTGSVSSVSISKSWDNTHRFLSGWPTTTETLKYNFIENF